MTAPCLVVASADELRDPDRLVSLVGRHRVTRTLCVPTLYGLLLDAAERAGTGPLASLRQVFVASEALPRSLVDRHFTVHSPGVELVNEYGPTETTVWATYHRFTGAGPVSIGGPIPGARLHVLDDELQPVPPGTEGELFIGGAGVTRAYFGRPWATAAVFLDDPFAGEPGARMYRPMTSCAGTPTTGWTSSDAGMTRSRSAATAWNSVRSSRRCARWKASRTRSSCPTPGDRA
ncbi:AMP-binding protein [Streptomyces europaeiscabiei]|uniref:AMP-binding protein n=1 Tax=Streptomyces europaeiscabiei TaxID=146819 RepID=UPI0029BE37AB|nr:AMP-binding protein [Streptomyces europaeiscabiei]MDX3866320.1 AMP-binding protein [Streptomyces europaeiscabiei]MDX3876424.1 AMP-binding protein [Streptomyces europaeiscabiei]